MRGAQHRRHRLRRTRLIEQAYALMDLDFSLDPTVIGAHQEAAARVIGQVAQTYRGQSFRLWSLRHIYRCTYGVPWRKEL